MKQPLIITPKEAKQIQELLDTNLFERYETTRYILRLKGTEFYFDYQGLFDSNYIRTKSRWRTTEWPFYTLRTSSFEAVFESVSEEVKMKLLFHLDLFRD